VRGPIALVGLMGSGKTTVGRRLAKLLDRPFVDADEEVEARSGRTIAEIFREDGEDRFRDLESDVLASLLADPEAPVIATGGGAVLRQRNRDLLRQPDVTVVWLEASPAFLASRVQRKAHRPLLAGAESPRELLERLHAEREPLYREVVDLSLSIEPFHTGEEQPKQAMAEQIAGHLRELEART